MALRNSTNGEITRHYSIEELKDAANLMRGYDLVALNAAGSGHAGGTLSIMDITAALYLRVAEHDPGHPDRRAGGAPEQRHHRESRALWNAGNHGSDRRQRSFGDSGAPWELIKEFQVSAEHIAHKALELVDIKTNHRTVLDEQHLLAGSRR
jgi:hypothetical protein